MWFRGGSSKSNMSNAVGHTSAVRKVNGILHFNFKTMLGQYAPGLPLAQVVTYLRTATLGPVGLVQSNHLGVGPLRKTRSQELRSTL